MAALNEETAKELIKKLDSYIDSTNKTQELLLRALNSQGGTDTALSLNVGPSASRLTTEAIHRQNAATLDVDSVMRDHGSTAGGEDSDDDENSSIFVQVPLQREEYDLEGFRDHLRNYEWPEVTLAVLNDLPNDKVILNSPSIFPTQKGECADRSHLTHYSIFDVGTDGAPLPVRPKGEDDSSRSLAIWNRLKSTNADSQRERAAVGRITIVREPSPLLFAALHYTMSKHFDVDEMYHFLWDDNPALAHPHRAFDNDQRKARSFVITFEYFTIIGDGCEPMAWQMADKKKGTDTDIPISRCSSVIGLSLEGDKISRVRNRDRRIKKRAIGDVYDPFAPWRVLNIQAYPDLRSNVEAHDSTKHYVNGPEAFLVTLKAELRDACKRLQAVYSAISELVEPPSDFMFNDDTRDALLFEDPNFTYSRRYFWAYQSLAIMNQDIQEMETSFTETFKDSVWNGTNKIIWPGEETQSSRHAQWRKRMMDIRKDLDHEIERLGSMKILNEAKMKVCKFSSIAREDMTEEEQEIKNLRDNLFSGTSVFESRQSVTNSSIAVVQGRNIKLLTLVTIFFLPLTFITSVFSMTAIPETAEFHHFAIATVCICVPCYLLIGSLNTQNGIEWWERHTRRFFSALGKGLARVLAALHYHPIWARKYSESAQQNQQQPRRKRRTHAIRSPSADRSALQARSTFNGMPQIMSRGTTDSIPVYAPPPASPRSRDRCATYPPVKPNASSPRSSTIKFGPPRKSATFRDTGDYGDLPKVESPTGMRSPVIDEEKMGFQFDEVGSASGNEAGAEGSLFSRMFKKRKGSKSDGDPC